MYHDERFKLGQTYTIKNVDENYSVEFTLKGIQGNNIKLCFLDTQGNALFCQEMSIVTVRQLSSSLEFAYSYVRDSDSG